MSSLGFGDSVPASDDLRDDIHYLEAKIILRPEPLSSFDSLQQFGKLIQHAAKDLGIGCSEPKKKSIHPEMREVMFFDTTDFRLYKNAFILRKRVQLQEGFAKNDPEIVCKYRHPSQTSAASIDMRPRLDGDYKIKFKEETLPVHDPVLGIRTLYSHNCQFGMKDFPIEEGLALSRLCSVIPPLRSLEGRGDDSLLLVNKTIVEETLLPLGHLHFSETVRAKCNIAVWRSRGQTQPLIGEFAYQVKFKKSSEMDAQARKKSDLFFAALLTRLRDHLALGTTKTAVVYRSQGAQVEGQE